MAPIVHGLEAGYGDRMDFTYLDVDDPGTGKFKGDLNYLYQPDIFLLDGQGNVLNRWTGAVPADELEAALLVALGG